MLIRTCGLMGAMALGIVGCNNRPTLFPNPDPGLRKSVTQFKEDAASRFPYKSDAPHVQEMRARAEIGYELNRIEVVNFSSEDWTDVEVWVNRQYVCHVPKMESRKLKEIHFPMLFNEVGKSFPMDNRRIRVDTLEVFRDGKMYRITAHPADT